MLWLEHRTNVRHNSSTLTVMDKEQAAIQAQRARWISALNKGSVTGFVAVLTDDVVWLPAGHDAIQGKKQIRAWLEKPLKMLDYDYLVSEVRVRVAGRWAVEEAKFSTRIRMKSGETLPPHAGSYTLLWRKTDAGAWLIERYIDRSADFVP